MHVSFAQTSFTLQNLLVIQVGLCCVHQNLLAYLEDALLYKKNALINDD